MDQFIQEEYLRLVNDVLDHEHAGKRRFDGAAPIHYPTRATKIRCLVGHPLTVHAVAGGSPLTFRSPAALIAFRDGGSPEAAALFADGYSVASDHY